MVHSSICTRYCVSLIMCVCDVILHILHKDIFVYGREGRRFYWFYNLKLLRGIKYSMSVMVTCGIMNNLGALCISIIEEKEDIFLRQRERERFLSFYFELNVHCRIMSQNSKFKLKTMFFTTKKFWCCRSDPQRFILFFSVNCNLMSLSRSVLLSLVKWGNKKSINSPHSCGSFIFHIIFSVHIILHFMTVKLEEIKVSCLIFFLPFFFIQTWREKKNEFFFYRKHFHSRRTIKGNDGTRDITAIICSSK
jgi:hypothetical protein